MLQLDLHFSQYSDCLILYLSLFLLKGGRSGGGPRDRRPRGPTLNARAPGSQLGISSPSPVPTQMQGQLQHPAHQLISQQAHQLLEEAKNENRMLEDTVATLKEQV